MGDDMRKSRLIAACVLAFALTPAAYASPTAPAAAAPAADDAHMLELFQDVLKATEHDYVKPVDDKTLIQSALKGMLSSLDPHSDYLTPDDFKDFQTSMKGEFGGVGIEITSQDGLVKVITPIDDTPAVRAGIKAGDFITAINGETMIGQTVGDASKRMRGPIGEPVTLTIARPKVPAFDVKITRELIHPKAVTFHAEGDYGYVRLAVFNEKATQETRAAIEALRAKNPHMKGLVLDLRNNSGGLVNQAVGVANLFLDGGEVVSAQGRDPKNIQRYYARPGRKLDDLGLVVLINGGTASASEIVAGALQDRHRAEIIGMTSFGKGSVQSIIPLRGGADGAIKVTIARYYTPAGRSIQKTGIEPDLEVAQTREQAELAANQAFQFSEAAYRNALTVDEDKARKIAHKPAEAPPKDFDEAKGDFQLSRALEVLKYGSVEATPKLPTASVTLATADIIRANDATKAGAQAKTAEAAKPTVPSPN